jgi:hypothetical protein
VRTALAALALALAAAAGGEEPRPPERLRLHKLEVRGVAGPLAELIEMRLCVALGEAAAREVLCPEEAAAVAELVRQEAVLGTCQSDDCLRRAERATASGPQVRGTLVGQGDGLKLSLTLTGAAGRLARAEALLPADLEKAAARLGPLARALLAPPAP